MRTSRLVLALSVLVALCCASLLVAQQPSVTLRLKFAPNTVTKYRIFAQGEGQMATQMPGMPPEMQQQMQQQMQQPLRATVTAVATTKVAGVDNTGAARIAIRLDSMDMRMSIMGKQMKMLLAGGKMTMSMDGQATQSMPLAGMMGQPGAKLPFLQEPVTIKMDPRGKVTDFAIPGLPRIPGMDMQALLRQSQILLPEQPLAVGESWSDHQALPYGNVPMVTDANYTLAGLETKNGKTLARINVGMVSSLQNADMASLTKQFGQTTAPQMQQMNMQGSISMEQKLNGVMLFNVTDGHISRFDFELSQQMVSNNTFTPPNQQQAVTMNTSMALNMKGAVAAL